VPKAEFVVAAAHLSLPVRSQGKWGMPTANGVFPIVLKVFCGLNQTTCEIRQVFVSISIAHIFWSTPTAIDDGAWEVPEECRVPGSLV
jgi:hypothetical protein